MKKQLLVKNNLISAWRLDETMLNDKMWKKIKNFEKTFSYPLGKDFFKIEHGRNGHYADFFLKMSSHFSTIVLECEEEIFCLITIVHFQDKNYICDFKSKNIFIKEKYEILKECFYKLNQQYSNSWYFVNMNQEKNNPVVKMLNIFFGYQFETKEIYLHQKNKKDINSNLSFTTNIGEKDIILPQGIMPLYHCQCNGDILYEDLPDKAVIMYCSESNDNGIPITVGFFNCKPNIFSYEI